jgi:hypothetical protein
VNFGQARIVVTLPPSTEEWAEDVVCQGEDYDWTAERNDKALTFTTTIGGNCDAVQLVASAMRDFEEGLSEGNISPSEVAVHAVRELDPEPTEAAA